MQDPPIATAVQRERISLWRPLRSPDFRNLLLANVVSDIGTFIQTVGAAWLMVSLNAGPMYVALIQTASALPFFLLALPAGSVGDIFDRRKVILFTEFWMIVTALVLAILTMAGLMSPPLLLLLTFALSAGDAFETPTWRAVLPELVGKEDLAAASALNGVEFNFARAVGPALGGVLVALTSVSTAFLMNVFSFVGVIVVVLRWKRVSKMSKAPPETIAGASRAALRYVRFSPGIRAVLVRAAPALFFAGALLALLPSVARQANGGAVGYGLLMGTFGLGAFLGAFVMQRAKTRWAGDSIINAGIVTFGLATALAGASQSIPVLSLAVLVAGASWICFISLFNVQVLNQAPDWVRARVLAITMLVFQGSVAAGSAAWGAIAAKIGLGDALFWAGAGTVLAVIPGLFLRGPDRLLDLEPWDHWSLPPGEANDPSRHGPVLVTVEYDVSVDQAPEFISTMRQLGRLRRRDGASRWCVCRDLELAGRYVEAFVVNSWAEHLRQHARAIHADEEHEGRLRKCINGEPKVRHLLLQ